LNLESLLFPPLQKHEKGKYQSKTRGMVVTLKRNTTTLRGSREVLAIRRTRMVSRSSSVEEEQELCQEIVRGRTLLRSKNGVEEE
jgi:hypothetical protein